jgi:hypothetical protein
MLVGDRPTQIVQPCYLRLDTNKKRGAQAAIHAAVHANPYQLPCGSCCPAIATTSQNKGAYTSMVRLFTATRQTLLICCALC